MAEAQPEGLSQRQLVHVSKALSSVLRHNAQKKGIAVRPDGYCVLYDVLQLKDFRKKKVTEADVRQVVNENNKKRFQLTEEEGVVLIRAVQGHTIQAVESEALLQQITDPFQYSTVIHGTFRAPMPFIMQGGLNRMARNHIHLAPSLPSEGVISGMRASCEVVIEVNMTKAMLGPHQIPFFVSENEVILTEGLEDGSLPTDYFRSVLDLKRMVFTYEAPIDFLCVFDFECTCTDDELGNPLSSKEIIEFPIVVVDVKARAIKSVFQTYVKPAVDPQLTAFCTELTGITQEQVDAGVSIQEAMEQVHQFLGQQGLFASEFVFVSCGDFDGNQIKREAQAKQFPVPNYLKRWINLRKVFPQHLFDSEKEPLDFSKPSTLKNAKPETNMDDWMERCGLQMEGRLHSGIDDAKNFSHVAINLLERGFQFTQGMVHVSK